METVIREPQKKLHRRASFTDHALRRNRLRIHPIYTPLRDANHLHDGRFPA